MIEFRTLPLRRRVAGIASGWEPRRRVIRVGAFLEISQVAS